MEAEHVAKRGVPASEAPNQIGAAIPGPPLTADRPADARGRRTLSTAFVMTGSDRRLTVELRNGRVLVLRDVVMRRKDYCGVPVSGDAVGGQYCGRYAEVVTARPGGVTAPEDPLTISAESPRMPDDRD